LGSSEEYRSAREMGGDRRFAVFIALSNSYGLVTIAAFVRGHLR
jgi:hypothetical protein